MRAAFYFFFFISRSAHTQHVLWRIAHATIGGTLLTGNLRHDNDHSGSLEPVIRCRADVYLFHARGNSCNRRIASRLYHTRSWKWSLEIAPGYFPNRRISVVPTKGIFRGRRRDSCFPIVWSRRVQKMYLFKYQPLFRREISYSSYLVSKRS